MKNIIIAVLLIYCANSAAQCKVNNTVFCAGERIHYDAYYNLAFIWLNAGKVTFSVDNVRKNGNDMYQLSAIGVTQKGYDKLYKVRDTFQVFIDPVTIEPLEYKQITFEGFYTAEHYYTFNKQNHTVQMRIRRNKKPLETKTLAWTECYHDLLSMVYTARVIDFSKYRAGDKIPIYLVIDGDNYELYIRYKGKETVTNRDGKQYNCLKFSPFLVEGTIFKEGEHMTVWVTDDRNRIPIIVEAEILIGSVKAYFTGAEGLKYSIEAEVAASF
ncbi:MAG: DUF3108 domain-containing protein [Cytophagaceae bacterium]|nr:DUF3108 domain-containing protein [Cytophagaceae bacterium]